VKGGPWASRAASPSALRLPVLLWVSIATGIEDDGALLRAYSWPGLAVAGATQDDEHFIFGWPVSSG
jgi:hypothetical protein